MKIIEDIDLDEFSPWSGAKAFYKRLDPEGLTRTELNEFYERILKF